MFPVRRLFAVAAFLLLAACAAEDLTKPPKPIGNFALGYNIVVAKNAQKVGPSRDATAKEWEDAITAEIARRTGRLQGDKLYHIGVGVDAYALALPGVPVVFKPRSILSVTVNVWDDTAQRKVNAEPKRFTVFEPRSVENVIGSGITQSREKQIQNLAVALARAIDKWLRENEAWFTPEAAEARVALGAMGAAPSAATVAAESAAGNPAAAPPPAN
ncbi:MAG: hypothetical protein N2422_10515 [Rhodobacteraceae bacterium]|nr:hypothetical protein [Paracoccaceae bacterium]